MKVQLVALMGAMITAVALSACGENPHVLGDDPTIGGKLGDPGFPGESGGKKGEPDKSGCSDTVLSEVQGRIVQDSQATFELTSVTGDLSAPIQNVYLLVLGNGQTAPGQQVDLCIPQLQTLSQRGCVSVDAESITRTIHPFHLLRLFDQQAVLDLIAKNKGFDLTVSGGIKVDHTVLQIERANDCSKQSKDPSPIPTPTI